MLWPTFRLDHSDFAQQKWFAGPGFFNCGCPVARRTTAVDVADQDLFTFQANGFDDLCEQLSRAPDKRSCLHIFVRAGRFSDEHQTRFSVAFCVDHVRSVLVKRAARAVSDFGVNLFEGFG